MERTWEQEVPPLHTGERLDRFLALIQTDLSRSRLQALIRDGRVEVNGRPARASTRVQSADRVVVRLPAPEPSLMVPEARPLRIVFEDEWLLVLDKPPGMVVHPGAGVREGTLVHALLHHVPGIEAVGGAGRPGIVHRLDKDTSGLMVVAKTERAYRALVAAIAAREVRRAYVALAWGVPSSGAGRIEAPIGRDPRHRKRMAVVRSGGRPAVTHWRRAESFGAVSLLELRLETGRTHQIRVHLAHLGHPVVGDAVYGGGPKKQLRLGPLQRSLPDALFERLHRQALHAAGLAFSHPVTGEALSFESPLPDDMAGALEALRSQRTG
jgi:23S rRNA pseudouridine1911/1915/1917 synthase